MTPTNRLNEHPTVIAFKLAIAHRQASIEGRYEWMPPDPRTTGKGSRINPDKNKKQDS